MDATTGSAWISSGLRLMMGCAFISTHSIWAPAASISRTVDRVTSGPMPSPAMSVTWALDARVSFCMAPLYHRHGDIAGARVPTVPSENHFYYVWFVNLEK